MVNFRTPTAAGEGRLKTGRAGEDIAEKYLRRKGYAILDRNSSTRFGELDIVARKGEIIVFVEVKAKARDDEIAPSLRVDRGKIIQVRRMAKQWLLKQYGEAEADSVPARVDIVGVCDGTVTEHYEDVTE